MSRKLIVITPQNQIEKKFSIQDLILLLVAQYSLNAEAMLKRLENFGNADALIGEDDLETILKTMEDCNLIEDVNGYDGAAPEWISLF